jgi:hypothetical protein
MILLLLAFVSVHALLLLPCCTSCVYPHTLQIYL